MSRARWRPLRGGRACRLLDKVLAVLLTVAVLPRAAAARSSWSVVIDGKDRSAAADPLEAAGEVLVDLAGLGPVLGLEVTMTMDGVAVVDRQGVRWTGRPGASFLRAGTEKIELSWVRQSRTAWHVPAGTLALLAGLDLTLDRAASVVALTSRGPDVAAAGASSATLERSTLTLPFQASAPASAGVPADPSGAAQGGGWQSFTLPKSADEMAASKRLEASQVRPISRRAKPVLPPVHQSLRATVGLGFRQGGEWGAEIAAFGLWSDWNVELSSTAVAGTAGSDVQGHLSLEGPGRLWSFEAGSLNSEAWGYAEGLRVERDGGRHRSALSLYLPGTLTRYRDPLVAFRSEYRPAPGVSLGGEATSEGRWSSTGRLRRNWFAGSVYAQGGGGAASSAGASVSLDLGKLGLSGSFQQSDDAGRRLETRNLHLTLPRLGTLSTALEVWDTGSDLNRSRAQGATFGLPMGDLRLRLRYLHRASEHHSPDRDSVSQEHHEVVALVGYARSSRLRLDLQVASRWAEGGEASHRADLQASIALTRGTHLQLLGGFSSVDDAPEHYLARLTQDLPRGLRLIAEVGDAIGFPVGHDLLEPGQEPGSVKILLQRSWEVATPAGGTLVGGRVLGPGGVRAGDVPVRLGPYRVYSDESGRYVFRGVPAGTYELSLEESGLPAHLQAVSAPVQVRVGRSERLDHALFVAPLGRICGRVFVDRDGDRQVGAEEGVGGVVLILDGRATTSTRDGSFSFHNLAAGRYQLEVEAALLPKGLEATSPSRFEIGLPAGESLERLEVRLQPRLRPVVFQEM